MIFVVACKRVNYVTWNESHPIMHTQTVKFATIVGARQVLDCTKQSYSCNKIFLMDLMAILRRSLHLII